MIRKRLIIGTVLGLFLGLGGCLLSTEKSKREERDKQIRGLVKAIVDNDLESAKLYARACMLPVTQDDITRDYGIRYGYIMPLHIAVRHGRVEILKMLAEKQKNYEDNITFDVDARDSDGQTALMHACFMPVKARDECVRFLVSQGADVNARSASLRATALHDAVHGIRSDYVSLLIELGANVNLQDRLGRTPLYVLCWHAQKITPDHEAIIDALIQAGADLNLKDRDGLTAEQIAEKEGNPAYGVKIKEAVSRLKQ